MSPRHSPEQAQSRQRVLGIGTIRARLLVGFVLLALVPAMAIAAGSIAVGYYNGRQQVIDRLESVAALKETEIEVWTHFLQNELVVALNEEYALDRARVILGLARDHKYYDTYNKAMRNRFQRFVEQTSQLNELFLMDLEGQVALSTDVAQEGKVYSDQIFFQRGLTGPYVQLPFYPDERDAYGSSPDEQTRRLVVAAIPVVDGEGDPLGVLAGCAGVETLGDILRERTGLGRTGKTYLVDVSYALLTESHLFPTSSWFPGQDLQVHSAGIDAAIENQVNGSQVYDDFRGVRVVGVYRWLPEPQVALLAEQDLPEALRAIYTTLGINMGIALISVLIAVGASLLITRSIATPLVNLVSTATQIADGDLERVAPVEREDEVGALAQAFNRMTAQLRDLINSLEQRVQERTQALQEANQALRQRALQLETSARVSQEITSILDIDDLLARVVDLIWYAFSYYHVHIFLVDQEANQLVLRASSGATSPQIQRLEIGRGSLNGTVAQTNEALLVNDVTQDLRYLADERLSGIRSELVIPLRVGEQVIGTLDAQSAEVNAFTPEDVLVIQSLGDQIAIAIENARLYASIQQELAERVRVEGALREGEDKYRALVAHIPDVTWTTDRKGKTTFISANVERVYGFTPEEIYQADSRLWFERVHPDDVEHVKEAYELLFAEDKAFDVEYRIQEKDGHWVWLHDRAVATYEKDGVMYADGVFSDITERKQAESQRAAILEALRDSEERYRAIVEDQTELVCRWLPDTTLAFVNQTYCRYMGKSSAELIGRSFMPLILENEHGRVRAHIASISTENPMRTVERPMLTPNGETRWLQWADRAIFDEKGLIVEFQSVGRDITERKLAEEALQKERDFISAILDTADALVVVLDRQGRIVRFNRACESTTGYSFDEVRGRCIWDLCLIPEEVEPVKAVFEELQTGQFPNEYENHWVARDGSRRLIAWSNTALLDREGSVEYIVGTGIDVEAERRRQRETRVLADMARLISSTLDLEEVLDLAAKYARDILKADHCLIALYEEPEGTLQFAAEKGFPPDIAAAIREAAIGEGELRPSDEARETVLEALEPLIIEDVLANPHVDPEIVEFLRMQSVLVVPIRARERTLGIMQLSTQQPQRRLFTAEEAELAMAMSNQAAVAIDNARHHEAERRRAEQFRAISEVGYRMTSIMAVDELLGEISRLIKEALGYYLVGIALIEGDELVFKAGAGNVWEIPGFAPPRLKVGKEGITGWVAQSGEPLLVPDLSQESRDYRLSSHLGEMRSELAVPLKAKEEVIGVLHAQSDRLSAFDESDLVVLQSVAHQAAIAIENARLYEHSRELAVLEERNRLARELHDSVTQSLYSLGLLAEGWRRLVSAGEMEHIEDHLGRIGEITQQALKEMRLLIHELRPPALELEGLFGALHRRLDAVENRAGVEARLLVEDLVELPAHVEEELYRIAQEALNNALKHAAATSVTVRIRADGEQVVLEVMDNGRGFNPEAASHGGGMGLVSMRERAKQMGGTLTILSTPGEGTTIRVEINPHFPTTLVSPEFL